MWKGRHNVPAQPEAATSKHPVRAASPARLVNPTTPTPASSSSSSSSKDIYDQPYNRTTSATKTPHQRGASASPNGSSSSSSTFLTSSSSSPDPNNTSVTLASNAVQHHRETHSYTPAPRGNGTLYSVQPHQQQSRRSPSPLTVSKERLRLQNAATRPISAQTQARFDSLARPRSAHTQLREEISSLRCRLQRTELEMKAKQAEQDKYRRIAENNASVKKQRKGYANLLEERRSQSNQRAAHLWTAQKMQEEKTRRRMQALVVERHDEVQDDKKRRGKFIKQIRQVTDYNDDLHRQSVQNLRDHRKVAKFQAAANQAKFVQKLRDDFDNTIGEDTRETQYRRQVALENKRVDLIREREETRERRLRIQAAQLTANNNARKEMEDAVKKGQKSEAIMLNEERILLLQMERRLLGGSRH